MSNSDTATTAASSAASVDDKDAHELLLQLDDGNGTAAPSHDASLAPIGDALKARALENYYALLSSKGSGSEKRGEADESESASAGGDADAAASEEAKKKGASAKKKSSRKKRTAAPSKSEETTDEEEAHDRKHGDDDGSEEERAVAPKKKRGRGESDAPARSKPRAPGTVLVSCARDVLSDAHAKLCAKRDKGGSDVISVTTMVRDDLIIFFEDSMHRFDKKFFRFVQQ